MKIVISIQSELLSRDDALVGRGIYLDPSGAIRHALGEKLDRLDRRWRAREWAKLDPKVEQALADEGLSLDAAAWPEF